MKENIAKLQTVYGMRIEESDIQPSELPDYGVSDQKLFGL